MSLLEKVLAIVPRTYHHKIAMEFEAVEQGDMLDEEFAIIWLMSKEDLPEEFRNISDDDFMEITHNENLRFGWYETLENVISDMGFDDED